MDQVLRRNGFVPYAIRYGRPGVSELRTVYMSKEVSLSLDVEKTDLDDDCYVGVVTKIDRFVSGAWLSVTTPTTDQDNGDVKGLRGYDDILFELRFYEVAPQQRLLGVFPK